MDDQQQLVAGARTGDDAAFTALVERYDATLKSLVAWYVRPQDVADAAQEVWLAVHAKLWQLRDLQLFLPWLRRIAYFRCVNFRKVRQRHQAREVYLDWSDWLYLSDCVAAETLSISDLLERDELRKFVAAQIDQMPADYGLMLRLRYGRGLAYNEIAELTELPLSTVKWRLHEAKRLLKDLLAGANLTPRGAFPHE